MPCPPVGSSGGGSGGSGSGAVSDDDERLIVLAKLIAPDIADNVDGADVCEYGFSVADTDDLQIIVEPMNQVDEPEDRDGVVKRVYVLWVVTHEKITRTDVTSLTNAANLVLRIAKRYPENKDLGELSPAIEGFDGCVVDDKQFLPFYDQRELDTTDSFHSVIQLSFRESL